MNYIKGKITTWRTFLLMWIIEEQISILSDSMFNNNDSDVDNVHSQEEEQQDPIFILDAVVNRFRTQIILTDQEKDFRFWRECRKYFLFGRSNKLEDSGKITVIQISEMFAK